jgi:hypothetical protein
VVKVPNGALRFTPDLTADQISALYQKAGIGGAGARKGGKATQQSGQQTTTAVVWKLNADKSVAPVLVKLGITDHTTTEVAQVVKGSLNPDDQVVTGSAAANKTASATTAAPGMGATRGGAGGRVGR